MSNASTVYFLHETIDEKHEITFGDGVLGKPVKNNNIIIVDYRVCNGTTTNGANTFSASGTVGGYSTVSVAVTNAAAGGSDRETVESIKFNAPKTYETQNRAVTTDDYKKIVEGNVS